MSNPLIMAVDAYDCLIDMQGDMMYEVAGDAAFDPHDEALNEAVVDLVSRASDAAAHLSPRAQKARLNSIWRQFVDEQIAKRNDKTKSSPNGPSPKTEALPNMLHE